MAFTFQILSILIITFIIQPFISAAPDEFMLRHGLYIPLKQAGVTTLNGVLALTPEKLLGLFAFDPGKVQEVQAALAARGLKLGEVRSGEDETIKRGGRAQSRGRVKLAEPLQLSAQTTSLLRDNGINTVRALLENNRDLNRLRAFKEINLIEIIVRLRERGVSFQDEDPSVDVLIVSKAPETGPLQFSKGVFNLLKGQGINTLKELLQKTYLDLLWGDPPLAPSDLQEVQVVLFERGLELTQEDYDDPDVEIRQKQKARSQCNDVMS